MFFPLYRQRVRSHVILQTATRIEKEMDAEGSATCSVFAHSMGTAVTHDCLHLLGTVTWAKKDNPLNPAHWRFQHLFMMANTSGLEHSATVQRAPFFLRYIELFVFTEYKAPYLKKRLQELGVRENWMIAAPERRERRK